MRAPTPVLSAVLAAAFIGCPAPEPTPTPPALVDLVDPTIGTGGFAFMYGGTFLGAALPHGLMKVGPDTTGPYGEIRFLHTSGNFFEDPTILCFSHFHLHGTGVPEGGVLAVMPTASFDAAQRSVTDYAATRIEETALPGRYSVHLLEPDIQVSLVATGHAALHTITFPDGTADAALLVDLQRTLTGGTVHDASLTVDGTRLSGRLHTEGSLSPPGGYQLFFVMESDAAFSALTWSDSVEPSSSVSASGTGVGAVLSFGPRDSAAPVHVRVAVSLVDADGAAANLAAEMPGVDEVALGTDARAAWAALLGRVRVEGGTAEQSVMLASSLYRSFLMPTVQSDVDGRWRGPDGQIRTASGFRMMTDMSLWDTYRTVHPLYALLAPESARDAALSIVAFTEVAGSAPLWTMATGDAAVMIGSPAEIVLADALARGIVTADELAPAWPMLRANALDLVDSARDRGARSNAIAYHDAGGYVPAPLRGPVSGTLEFNQADLALARIADAMGAVDDAAALRARARGWRRLFDPTTRFLRGRDASGAFAIADADFAPADFSDDYVEADAWQSNFPYDDVPGIVETFGSGDAALARIGELLDNTVAHWDDLDRSSDVFGVQPLPFHWQGNEGDLHVPFLAYDLGDKALAARFVRWVMTEQYGVGPEGIPGNDDGGAMSSWWALASFGLNPVPGSDAWIVGAPLFSRVELDLDGRTFVITAAGDVAGAPQSVTLDDEPVTTPRIPHAALQRSTSLHVERR